MLTEIYLIFQPSVENLTTHIAIMNSCGLPTKNKLSTEFDHCQSDRDRLNR